MTSQTERAGTVELNASVDGVEMYAYMVPGCCGLRSFYGLNKGTPEQVVVGIATSGISGCMMILTDAYSNGEHARAFKKFVEAHQLGSVTISNGIPNQYTGKKIYGVVFEYRPQVLLDYAKNYIKLHGGGSWEKPKGWWTNTDSVHMDGVFYQYGGRPKPKDKVNTAMLERAAEYKGLTITKGTDTTEAKKAV